jgi:ABC-type transport system involved in cytochrome c biogenesis permease component
MSFLTDALVISKKDILLELRGKEALTLMLFLSLLLLVIFNFAFDIDKDNVSYLAPGILWVIFAFSGILGMGRTSMAERDEEAYLSIVFSPASSESFYLGKVFSNSSLILNKLSDLSLDCFLHFFSALSDFHLSALFFPFCLQHRNMEKYSFRLSTSL